MLNHLKTLLSYTLATMAGIGLANIISMLDYVLDSPRKRHITGGLLLSASMLFGSLALTVFTLKNDEITVEEEPEYGQEE